MVRPLYLLSCLLLSGGLCGCAFLPEVAHQPNIHNPFPQLSKVAVAPFFNLTEEPTVDGEGLALAYFNELQAIPGFEVVPVGVVRTTMQQHNLQLNGPAEARRLAQLLGVDAVLVGAVTDYSPYYPPRCGLQVEWYAANPGFHPIPPGYGLPWGTPEEEHIPEPLVFEAEMALAKAQLATQTPQCEDEPAATSGLPAAPQPPATRQPSEWTPPEWGEGVQPMSFQTLAEADPELGGLAEGAMTEDGRLAAESAPGLPPDWPDPRGFVPPGPRQSPPTCWPSDKPVIRHMNIYNGHDAEFTEALANYYFFRDDARFGGWQSYLQRSEDFLRFCCHLHLAETLTARGGAGETRVVWRWPSVR